MVRVVLGEGVEEVVGFVQAYFPEKTFADGTVFEALEVDVVRVVRGRVCDEVQEGFSPLLEVSDRHRNRGTGWNRRIKIGGWRRSSRLGAGRIDNDFEIVFDSD